MKRQLWIEREHEIPLVRQCELTGVARSTLYAQRQPVAVDETDLLLCRLIDEEYTRRPFYGSRRMVVLLKSKGHEVNRKRVQRLNTTLPRGNQKYFLTPLFFQEYKLVNLL